MGSGDKPYLRGFKCLHEHCARRGVSNFLAWVSAQGGPSVAPTAPIADLGKLLRQADKLTMDERYQVVRESFPELYAGNLPDAKCGGKENTPLAIQLATSPNVAYILKESGVKLRFNMQKRESEFVLRDEAIQEAVPNEHTIKRQIMDSSLRLGVTNTKSVETIMIERALDNRYHPMQEWIERTPWDGQSRLKELADTVEVAQDEYDLWPVFLRKWLIQGVQAVCGWEYPKQIGSVLVFSGEQFQGKTRWFSSLVPKNFFIGFRAAFTILGL